MKKEPMTQQLDPSRVKKTETNSRGREDARVESAARRDGGRIPLGAPHQKLTLMDFGDQLEGFVPRWFTDTKTRIRDALRAGYEPIYRDGVKVGDGDDRNSDMGSWVSQVVGTNEAGQPLVAYALKIREAWHKEDKQEKQKAVDMIDEAIRGEGVNSQAGDGRYVKQNTYQVGSKI